MWLLLLTHVARRLFEMASIKGHLALTGSVTFIVCLLRLLCVTSNPLCILRYVFILYLRLTK